MSVENVKSFYAKVKEDEKLQHQIKEQAKGTAEESMQALVGLAAAQGFPFDKKDLEAFIDEETKKFNTQGELSDAELAEVAGGDLFHWVVFSLASLGGACTASALTNVTIKHCVLDEEPVNPKPNMILR
ncbi:nif11-like leader peptide domain-containing protein [Desulfotomaculum arcticum]|uniref:Nif11-like leader peptide domain-containing protein n=1 Tax=Desulfotruncus arcticus DSM 17038 TaxID=1121424 RepID=A0A1I2PHX7_9FIRM|nr:Nif11-like leader peptide family RiPP precursor [Desulfotruncus arcticus]SFG13236.1 nif11-like leader peptide domain-containing protein [Desulfotomaculum arcticum] [Desulfotruncus arcticus DSM 17038]